MITMKDNSKLIQAIHNVQQEIDIIKKNATADVGKYKYSYTPFPEMWVALKPLLHKYDLTILQIPVSTDGQTMGDFLQTQVIHAEGESMTWHTKLVITRDDPQGYGSAMTYAERYIIKTIFKIVTDDDNDATTQRKADGSMKKDWVVAYNTVSLKNNPEHIPGQADFMKFMTEVYGKHPSNVLAKEHNAVLEMIKAFDTEKK